MGTEDIPQRPERPLGVTALTIWDGVMVGVVPAIRSGIIIANTSNQESISILTLCLATGIPIAIVSAAFGTFRGNDRARLSLLVLLTIYFSLNAFQSVILLVSSDLIPEEQLSSVWRIITAIISVGINLWYFLRPKTIAFFRKPIEQNN